MKKIIFILFATAFFAACSEKKTTGPAKESALTDTASLISRGKYIVSIAGCHDCHSPKIMTEQGPIPDPARLLSGHPADEKLPLFDTTTSKGWILFSMGLTAAKGPWGTSFSANLTPDETGIANWTEKNFFNALRNGDFKGLPGGRKILPPMPWQDFAKMTDEDIRAIFFYLKSLPPVKNIVPNALPPGK